MSEQLRRQIELLRSLPKAGNAKTTAQLHQQLEEQGYRCSKRTAERDLELLLQLFPEAISRKSQQGDNGRTHLWHQKDNKPLLPETLLGKPELALAMTLLKQQAYSRLPLRIFNLLKPLWEQASTSAEQHRDSQKWLQISRYLPNPLRPETPAINPKVQETIESALLSGDVLYLTVATLDGHIQYKRLLPMRLLQREEILLLLAENPAADDINQQICTLPMHCITQASSSLSLDGGSGIDPDLAQNYALGTGERLQLHLRINRTLAEALFERPLGSGQRISASTEQPGWYELETVIEDSPQLQRWLKRRGLNGELVVL